MLSLPGRFLIPNMASTLRSPTRGVRLPPSSGVKATWLFTMEYPLVGLLFWPDLMLPVSTTYCVLVSAQLLAVLLAVCYWYYAGHHNAGMQF
jgi:hypothetical protein